MVNKDKEKTEICIESILQEFTLNKDIYDNLFTGNLDETAKIIFDKYFTNFSIEEEIKNIFKPFNEYFSDLIIEEAKVLIRTGYEQEAGLVYAHEYDKHFHANRFTKQFHNGFKQYEVYVVDKTVIFVDGIWEDPNHNGYGDYFELI